jgi:hypothetical protein
MTTVLEGDVYTTSRAGTIGIDIINNKPTETPDAQPCRSATHVAALMRATLAG